MDSFTFSPLVLLGVAMAMLLLALFSRLLDRRNAKEELDRVKLAATGGEGMRRQAAQAPVRRQTVFAERRTRTIWQRIAGITGYDPDVIRLGGLPPLAIIVLAVAAGLALYTQASPRIGSDWAAAVSVATALGISRFLFAGHRRKWQTELFRQIPDAMGLITRAIRTGLPMNEALQTVSREMPEPTRTEFARVLGDLAIGRTMEQALIRLRDRSNVPEYGFFAVTLGLQSQTGGSLAETLENLGDLVRKRVNMAAKVKALSAEARFGAIVLTVLPFLGVLTMSVIRPGYADFFLENPLGIRMAIVAIVMMALGVFTIRLIIRKSTED